jgi:chromosome segregation ATPase
VDPVSFIATFLGGGALLTFIGKLLELWLGRNKSLRDELRAEIGRLEGNIKALEGKVQHLENEVETWKNRVDEWRLKYFTLLEEHQLLKLAAAAKDQAITRLKLMLEEAGVEVPADLEPPTD